MPKEIRTVTIPKGKDCKGSVCFAFPKLQPGQKFEMHDVDSIYVNRTMPGINEAQEIKLTLEITK